MEQARQLWVLSCYFQRPKQKQSLGFSTRKHMKKLNFNNKVNIDSFAHTLCLHNLQIVNKGLHVFILCSFSAEWRRPVIKWNSKVVAGSEVVVRFGSPLDLRCEGDRPVTWQTRLPKHRRYISKNNGNVRTLKVERPTAEFTGTYKCVYTTGSRQLTSSVHVYVKGMLE